MYVSLNNIYMHKDMLPHARLEVVSIESSNNIHT